MFEIVIFILIFNQFDANLVFIILFYLEIEIVFGYLDNFGLICLQFFDLAGSNSLLKSSVSFGSPVLSHKNVVN
jgi:hypothetical protein